MSGRGRQIVLRIAFAAIAIVAVAGCVPATTIVPVNDLAELKPGSVLLVGKVELAPPLAPDEQDLGGNYEEYRNVALLITDDTLRDATELALGDMKRALHAPLGETFFVSHPAGSFYILHGWVIMRAKIEMVAPGETVQSGNAPLYGAFHVDIRPDDTAVYVGTIRYHRDTFFGIEKVAVVDEFAKARAEFRRKFGAGASLRKSLVRPATSGR